MGKGNTGGYDAKNDAYCSFQLEFTDEQKQARRLCHDNIVSVLTGKPGTAKSTVAASVALELLFRGNKDTHEDTRLHGKYKKIILTRPIEVVGKDIGFMPGDMVEKLAPYTAPIINVMQDLLHNGEAKVKELIDKGMIEIIPLQFMRGHTFKDCIVILDEGQSADLEAFKVLSSRIGKSNAKLIITSDWRQIDLRDRNKSASKWFDHIMHLDGVDQFELTENFRHPLAVSIMDILMELADQEKAEKEQQQEKLLELTRKAIPSHRVIRTEEEIKATSEPNSDGEYCHLLSPVRFAPKMFEHCGKVLVGNPVGQDSIITEYDWNWADWMYKEV